MTLHAPAILAIAIQLSAASSGQAGDGGSPGAQSGCWPADPNQVTIGAAHGSGLYLVVAKAFLTGRNLDGDVIQQHYAPDELPKCHLHRGNLDARPYYKDTSQNGLDHDPTHGIEHPTLLFYAGHGSPHSWSAATTGEKVLLEGFRPGDLTLRYLWMCGCNVLAHGPKKEAGRSKKDYLAPWEFPFSNPASPKRMNVFERWHHALSADIRLVCGGSSEVCGGQEEVTERLWRNLTAMSVSDSFLQAVLPGPHSIPMCIARGGLDQNTTPLSDRRITTDRPRADSSHTYILYPRPVGATERGKEREEPPRKLPVWRTRPVTYLSVDDLEKRGLRRKGGELISEDGRTRLDARTGSWSRRGDPPEATPLALEAATPIDRKTILERSRRAIAEYANFPGPHLSVLGAPWVGQEASALEQFRVESTSVFLIDRSHDLGDSVDRFLHSATARFRRWIKLPAEVRARTGVDSVPTLGIGGLLLVQTAPDGALVSALLAWHQLDRTESQPQERKLMPFAKALRKATRELGPLGTQYELDSWRWGYQEESGSCLQRYLRVAYEFDFVAATAGTESEPSPPPRRIVVPAQKIPASEVACGEPGERL